MLEAFVQEKSNPHKLTTTESRELHKRSFGFVSTHLDGAGRQGNQRATSTQGGRGRLQAYRRHPYLQQRRGHQPAPSQPETSGIQAGQANSPSDTTCDAAHTVPLESAVEVRQHDKMSTISQ